MFTAYLHTHESVSTHMKIIHAYTGMHTDIHAHTHTYIHRFVYVQDKL